MLGDWPKGTAKEEGGSRAELMEAEKEEAMGEAEDVTMSESATTAGTGTETETGAPATND